MTSRGNAGSSGFGPFGKPVLARSGRGRNGRRLVRRGEGLRFLEQFVPGKRVVVRDRSPLFRFTPVKLRLQILDPQLQPAAFGLGALQLLAKKLGIG